MKSSGRSAVPRMAQALVPREMVSWAVVSVSLGAVEGGVVGVLVKNLFADVAPPIWVNVAVALVSGAPAFANILSFAFAVYAQGRDKVSLLSRLLGWFSVATLLIAVAPHSAGGLVLLTLGVIAARVFWSASVTVRSAVWRANFPRQVRARITGQMTTLSSLMIAITGGLIGLLLDYAPGQYRWVWLFAALAGGAAALIYRQARVRRHNLMLRREREQQGPVTLRQRWQQFGEVLSADRDFRNYMIGMFVFGSGNLMMLAPLIVILNDSFVLGRLEQVLITSTLPLIALATTVPLWAPLLDGSHIIDYRARQSWFFVAAILFFTLAVIFGLEWLLWLGGVTLGVAYAGGNLGWNLGHNDFTDDRQATIYMGIHVTLTGLRGLIMPPLGVLFYEFLRHAGGGLQQYSLVLPLVLSTSGACWFVYLHRCRRREGRV
ncbi:MAG: hypothetical protein Tsb002_05810 [Wenzhouxiangellaceae bacterium]